jgi:hypothetical protein
VAGGGENGSTALGISGDDDASDCGGAVTVVAVGIVDGPGPDARGGPVSIGAGALASDGKENAGGADAVAAGAVYESGGADAVESGAANDSGGAGGMAAGSAFDTGGSDPSGGGAGAPVNPSTGGGSGGAGGFCRLSTPRCTACCASVAAFFRSSRKPISACLSWARPVLDTA